ncbi:serine/threonine-protein phosphatase 6 regulatory ankyrin repeat subunit C-like [Schistocerca cancellata]|uniref:serine/threonine-protein phosphatase 6 regulatory ankyrin repeat subunit C-like n=1 Tax=Schistocerca cancellata TaxID=274614 RepID=UPI002117B8BC|nr:serine/threonine-protein phosphatase 6 regulatory ankyrin repeat subunit C-like [Schistocerca cancellata]
MSVPSQQRQTAGASDPQSELLAAMLAGDFGRFEQLLASGAAHAAHLYGSPHFGNALVVACRHRELPPTFAQRLLCDVSPNVHEPRPEPVHYAARSGNVAALQELLSRKKTRVSAQTACGRTALHWAVLGFRDAPADKKLAARLEACVAALVDCPLFDVNRADDEGFTALHLAALYALPRAAAAIIDSCRRSRRTLQVDNYFGGRQTARQAVLASLPQLCGRLPRPADGGAQTVHMRLLRAMDDRDPLRYEHIMDAAADKEGFDPDVWIEQPFNTRLLHHACKLAEHTQSSRPQKEEPVGWLGEENSTGLPPLVAALFAKDFGAFCSLLQSRDVRPNEQYEALGGCTCLELACRHPDVPVCFVRQLLDSGARPNVDSPVPQPVHFAARWANPGALAALLSHPETRVNAMDAGGRTALHGAVLELVGQAPGEVADALERCVQLLVRCPRLDVNCGDALGFSSNVTEVPTRGATAQHCLRLLCRRSAHRDLDVDSAVVGGRTARQAVAADLPDLAWELPPPQGERDAWSDADRLQVPPPRGAAGAGASQLALRFASVTLEFGADPTAANLLDSRTALHVVAATGNSAIAELLLSHPPQSFPVGKRAGKFKSRAEEKTLINMRDRDGNTALHLAARCATSGDKLDCLRILLAAKDVAPWLHNSQGETAIHVSGCAAAKDLILKHTNSARPEWRQTHYSDDVRNLFEMIINNKFSELIDELEQNNAWHLACTDYCGYTLLQYAAEKGLYEVAEALLKRVNLSMSYDANGRTPLMLACVQNDCKMVRLLLEADGIGSSNVNAFDSKNNTALHFAAENGDLEIVLILLRHGADVCARNKTGKYPFSAEQLEAILDKNLYTKGNRLPSHRNYVVVFNYRLLVRHRQCSPPTANLSSIFRRPCKVGKTRRGVQTAPGLQSQYSEMYFLNCLINSKQHTSLLHHPVISSFLKLKYDRAKWLLYLNLFLSMIFAILINTFIGVHISNRDSDDETVTEFSLRVVVIILAVIMSVRVLLQYLLSPLPCFKNLENAVAFLVIIFTGLVLSGSLGSWSHAALTGSVLSSWLHLFVLTGRHHLFSKNFEMFKTVSANYLRLLGSYIFVVFAFAFSFYIIFSHVPISNRNSSIQFPENISERVANLPSHENSSECAENNFFESPTRAIFKTFIMMTGEYDAGDLPFRSNFWTGAIVFILFLFLLPVVLLNLLTALAISDEQRIRSMAGTLKLVIQVKFLWETEGMAMNAHGLLKHWGYSRLAEHLETLWVFHRVPANDAYIEVWPNRVGGIRISGTHDSSHKLKPRIVQNAINIVKNRTASSAEPSDKQRILSEILKRLESLDDKFQKLTVDLEASLTPTTREQQPDESLLALPTQ